MPPLLPWLVRAMHLKEPCKHGVLGSRAHTASASQGGKYEEWDKLGMMQLPNSEGVLLISTGIQKGLKFEDGDVSECQEAL